MTDAGCVRFLQAVLPRLRMRWPGFRRVRGQVCKRVSRRMRDLGLESVRDYTAYLENHQTEWSRLDALCRVTISRFWRDRAVLDRLRDEVLPELLDRVEDTEQRTVRCWSAGCASGEEAYSIALAWELGLRSRYTGAGLQILATDSDQSLLDRAREAAYPPSSLGDKALRLRR